MKDQYVTKRELAIALERNNSLLIDKINDLFTVHINHVDDRFTSIDKKIGRLEEAMDVRFDTLQSDINHWKDETIRIKRHIITTHS